ILSYYHCLSHNNIQRPRAQEPPENHCRDYRNPPREEQGRVPGEPPSNHSAEAPGSCRDEFTGPAGSRLHQSRPSHVPRDPGHITPQAEARESPGVQAPACSHQAEHTPKHPAPDPENRKDTNQVQCRYHIVATSPRTREGVPFLLG
ncbi:hypothetical protein AMECASPLE_030947, partial [Ameca splendens]